jgi:UDP-N-acetylmuramoyl-tripeptide--D-alanyl-D-alanine ligase
MRWTAAFVGDALGLPPGGGGEYSEISTDTRTLQPGALFVALAGERFDGHDHLERARDAGARAAIVRRGTRPLAGLHFYEVDDTLVAYGHLARARRQAITGPVVAITGSNGKTSTKEMVAAVLRIRFATHATRLNLNNLVGIPQTILAAPEGTDALVIEAGANMAGEIGRARAIIEPTVAMITNVAESHLEGFGSVEGVLQEKLALVEEVPLAVVGTDPPQLASRAKRSAQRVITAGLAGADITPATLSVAATGESTFTIDGMEVTLPLRGAHQAGNAMLAWSLVRELSLDPGSAAAALSGMVLPGGRGEVLRSGGLTIVHDAYNANPSSFRAAISTAQTMRSGRRLVFVAGSMRELGPDAGRLHQDIARRLADLAPDLLAVVGDFVPAIAPLADSLGDRLLRAADPVELGPLLASRLQGNELIFLKASRGVALERILPFLGVTTDAAHNH